MNSDGNPDQIRVETIADQFNLDSVRLYEAVKLKLSGASLSSPEQSETEFRYAEYEVLSHGESREDSELVLRSRSASEYGAPVSDYFDRVITVEKLAETRALTGFSRISPPSASESLTDGMKKLAIRPKRWLPAVRVYGEGLFFTLRRDLVSEWAKHPAVVSRSQKMTDNASRVANERGTAPRDLAPAFFLLHALAHVLIRELSFSCGYGAASVRERIYCGTPEDPTKMLGILIYTAAGDAEGTLGGLTRQGRPGTLEGLVANALLSARWCASDPVCVESMGQGTDGLNCAACHACCLLPETSCEEGNRLLDRVMLIGSPSDGDAGFFSPWLERVVTSV